MTHLLILPMMHQPSVNQDDMYYRYRVTTPFRLNAGIAYQLGNFGLLSADYEMVDYGSAKLSRGSDGYEFEQENEDLSAEMIRSGNLRLGAEVRTGPSTFAEDSAITAPHLMTKH
jgi:hypothetical protein